jgi:hypothetical protein
MGFFDNRKKHFDFDPVEETFGLEGLGERSIPTQDFKITDTVEGLDFGLDFEDTVQGVEMDRKDQGFEFDPMRKAEKEFKRSASAERPLKTGVFGSMPKNQKIGMILQMVSAATAVMASKDPGKTALEFAKMGQRRGEAAAQREHELRSQERGFRGQAQLQAQAQDFAREESGAERTFKFEYQRRDSDYVMDRVLKEQGFDMTMEAYRQKQAWKRLGSEQQAQLRASAFEQALAIFPEGDMEAASQWASCASGMGSCDSPLVEQFSAGINKNVQIQRAAERAQLELQRMEQVRLSASGTHLNPITGSIEPIPQTLGSIMSITQQWSDGAPISEIAGTLVQDAETVLMADSQAALESVIRDGDRAKIPEYINGIRTIAEQEGRDISDHTMVRELSKRVGATRQDLQTAGVYGGDTITLSKSLANADVNNLLSRHGDLHKADEGTFNLRVSAGILKRAQEEGYDSLETEAALKAGLSRAHIQRIKFRGMEVTTKLIGHIVNTVVGPHVAELMGSMAEAGPEIIQTVKDVQF